MESGRSCTLGGRLLEPLARRLPLRGRLSFSVSLLLRSRECVILIRDLTYLLLFARPYAYRIFGRGSVLSSVVYDLWTDIEEGFEYRGLKNPNIPVDSGKGNDQS